MSNTAKRLQLARTVLQDLLTARDNAAKKLGGLRAQESLEHVTVDELAKGQVPSVAAAAAALRELERRCREQLLTVQGLEADLRREQAAEVTTAYLVKLGEFVDQLDAFEEMVNELVQMRRDLTQLEPFSLAPSLARLHASMQELRLQYDVARGARYSMEHAERPASLVLVDGQSISRAEWEERPKKATKGEAIAAFFKRPAG